MTIQERYLVDEQGKPVAVLIDIEVYRHMLEALEEMEAIRAYDEAKSSGEHPIPMEQAFKELESPKT